MSKLTLSFKGTTLRVYPVIKGSMIIGSDPASTIHIDSLALAPQHARIDTQADTSVLVELDNTPGTFVNNERIKKHMLADGDVIRVGKHTLTYKFENETAQSDDSSMTMEIPEAAPEPGSEAGSETSSVTLQVAVDEEPVSGIFDVEQKKHAWLQIMSGQNMGKTLSLNRPMTNLGKPGIATAVITRRNDGFFLSHLEGDKPPLVGNQNIGDNSVKLNDGETISIGNIKMLFFLD